MKFKKLIALLCLSWVWLSVFAVASESPAPLVMLQHTSDQLIAELKKNQSKLKSQPALVNSLIARTVLPHFDIEGIARSTVGQYGKVATAAQWAQFKKEVIGLVMKNYAAPLTSFDDDAVQFFPIRSFTPGQKQVEVKSMIIRKNGQKIPVTYRLTHKREGWKVSDFSVEGISMVQSYRSQFMPVLSEQGFTGLLSILNKRRQ